MKQSWIVLFVALFLWACDDDSTTNNTPVCGNGAVEEGEQCDTDAFNGMTCEGLGFDGGALICNEDCTIITSSCSGEDPCGNGTIDAGETCDGTDLGTETCETQGRPGGTLLCSDDCQLDLSQCDALIGCGDGVIDSGSEVCDGDNLGTATCVSQGFDGGVLQCNESCQFDTTLCIECGNNVAESGEQCDGDDLAGESCESLGFYGGTLSCIFGTCAFDTSSCEAFGKCGDGVIQPSYEEECDAGNMGGYSDCPSFSDATITYHDNGFTPSCDASCLIDISGCVGCGDGNLDTEFGEQCEGFDLFGETCITMGWGNGDLSCYAATCQQDTTLCTTYPHTAMAAGGWHTCVLSSGGAAFCWGHSDTILGTPEGTDNSRAAMVVMPEGITFSAIEAGYRHTCALDGTGDAWCWGDNTYGQCGTGTTTDATVPTRVQLPAGVHLSQISLGTHHTCALTTTGAPFCWGRNIVGQLGNGTTTDSASPVPVGGMILLSNITSISAGSAHSCYTNTDGNVYCWGANNLGQLGIGTTSTMETTPRLSIIIMGSGSKDSVRCGANFSCTINTSGTLYCWGENTAGQLGRGNQINDASMDSVIMPTSITFTEYALGAAHACAIGNDDQIYCWGDNYFKQAGQSTSTEVLTPTLVAYSLKDGVSLTAGSTHTCRFRSTLGARISCWGNNNGDQLSCGPDSTYVTPCAPLEPLQ